MRFLSRIRRMPAALGVLWAALWDRRTPMGPRLLALAAAAYLVWPLDVVPDVIPLAGWLDELVVLPVLLGLARRALPAEVVADAERPRTGARRWPWAVLAVGVLLGLGWWVGA